MSDKIHNISSAQKLPIPLDAWKLFSNDFNELVILVLKPNEILPAHENDLDVIFYLLEGEGILDVEGNIHNLGKDDCIHVRKSLLRGWQNNGASDLKLLVVKQL